MNWHSSAEGPWWKRLRIALFGLTAVEQFENLESLFTMRERALAESTEKDRLFDEYCALPGRPRIKVMMREIEGAPLVEVSTIDLVDFERWRKERAERDRIMSGLHAEIAKSPHISRRSHATEP